MHGVEQKWAKEIEYHHYNHRNRLSSANVLGVSTYATFLNLVEGKASLDALLSDPSTASLDAFGVIGYKVDVATNRALALGTSIKLAMTTWQQGKLGYSKGQVGGDVTFTIFKEMGLDMMTFMSQDIAQNGKPFCFGPTTHQDTEQFTAAGNIMADFVNGLVLRISDDTLPGEWTLPVRQAIMKEYSVAVQLVPKEQRALAPEALVSDEANAINDGMALSKLGVNVKVKKTDYPHIIRAVLKWIKSRDTGMKDTTEERITELLTDIAFIHEVFEPNLLVHVLVKFKEKWHDTYGERNLYNYLHMQHLKRSFSRCHGPPGEATDTCALECFHRVLKSEGGFDTVEGLGTVISRMNLVMHP